MAKKESDRKRVAMLYIATGPYIRFFDNWRASCREHMFPEADKTFFLWTDAEVEPADDTVVIHKEWKPWPDATKYRTSTFLQAREQLLEHDYCLYMNANSMAVADISIEDVFGGKELATAMHFTLWYQPDRERLKAYIVNMQWTNKTDSKGFVPLEKLLEHRGGWAMGGFQGGTSKAWVAMCEEVAGWIADDDSRNCRIRWHDEAYWNKYVSLHDVNRLSPEYLCPETYDIPAKKSMKVKLIDKNNFFGRSDFRTRPRGPEPLLKRLEAVK